MKTRAAVAGVQGLLRERHAEGRTGIEGIDNIDDGLIAAAALISQLIAARYWRQLHYRPVSGRVHTNIWRHYQARAVEHWAEGIVVHQWDKHLLQQFIIRIEDANGSRIVKPGIGVAVEAIPKDSEDNFIAVATKAGRIWKTGICGPMAV